jgi:hypothetical protein
MKVPEAAWVQAINGASEDRDGAWVTELIDRIDLSAWPEGSRLICRSERPWLPFDQVDAETARAPERRRTIASPSRAAHEAHTAPPRATVHYARGHTSHWTGPSSRRCAA